MREQFFSKNFKKIIAGIIIFLVLSLFIPLNFPPSGSKAIENRFSIEEMSLVPRPAFDLADLNNRPLFALDRKPFIVANTALQATNKVDEFLGWSLTGTMELGQSSSIAWIKKGNEPPHKLSLQDTFNGWIVTEIKEGKVTFMQNDEIKIMEITTDGQK